MMSHKKADNGAPTTFPSGWTDAIQDTSATVTGTGDFSDSRIGTDGDDHA